MVRFVEVLDKDHPVFLDIKAARACIDSILNDFSELPKDLRSVLYDILDLLDKAREYFEGCDTAVIPAKR
jgi:hypothetical protein